MITGYTITYSGTSLSLNQSYNLHWAKLKPIKDNLKLQFKDLLSEANLKPLEAFKLSLRYNSRLDCDNTVAMAKILVDTLRFNEYIVDDTKTIYQGFNVEYDSTLKKNVYNFTIIPVKK